MSKYYENEDDLFQGNRASNTLSEFTAEHEDTPPDLLARLAVHPNYRTRRLVAANPNTPTELLYGLADDRMNLVILSVARRPVLPDDLKAKLAEHKYWGVRAQIAKHPHSEDITQILLKDSNAMVRSLLAQNRSITPAVLTLLSKDVDSIVVDAVSLNPSTPVETLLHLMNSSHKGISAHALDTFVSLDDEVIQTFLRTVFNEEMMLPRDWLIKLASEGYFDKSADA